MIFLKKRMALVLYILIPIILANIIGAIFQLNIGLTFAAIYGVLILFLIPGDVFFSASSAYQTKRINPHF